MVMSLNREKMTMKVVGSQVMIPFVDHNLAHSDEIRVQR